MERRRADGGRRESGGSENESGREENLRKSPET